MKYRIMLHPKHYRAIEDKLAGHAEVMPYHMRGNVVLRVDEQGRAVIEERLPGRVNWNAHQMPWVSPEARS